MNAKDYLKQIKKIDTQLKNKAFELKQLSDLGVSTADIRTDIAKLQTDKAKIIDVIEQLPEAEYDVLHKVYVQYKSLYEVADERDISYSLATSIHGRALKLIEPTINAAQ